MRKELVYLAHLPQWDLSQPPLGIAYVGSYLSNKGIPVILKDFNIDLLHLLPLEKQSLLDPGENHHLWCYKDSYEQKIAPFIEQHIEKWANEILSREPQIVGFSVLNTNTLCTIDIINRIKQKNNNIIVIVGGPSATRYIDGFNLIKKPNIDYVIPGEGEKVTYELCKAIFDNNNIESIKGILLKKEENIIDTGEREFHSDINDFPFPILEQFPADKYKDIAIPIITSRGCIYNCAFCSEKRYWNKFRFRSAENIFNEMKFRLKHFSSRYFYVADSLINGNIEELEKLCKLIIKNDLNIEWGGKASIRKEMDNNIIKLLADAGCTNIAYGIESGSTKVLSDMKKRFNIENAIEIIKSTHNAGIKVCAFFLIGFPTESDNDFELTKQFIKDNKDYLYSVTIGYGCGIPSGSDLYNDPSKYGIFWKDGNWFSKFTSPKIRHKRVEELRQFCNDIGQTYA